MADGLHARQAFVSLDSDWIDANRAETRISAIIANVLPPMQMILKKCERIFPGNGIA